MKKENKTTIKNAELVLSTFPSAHEIMNGPQIKNVLHPLMIMAFSRSQEWEGVAMAVNQMCISALDRPFYKDGYMFPGNSENGTVICYTAMGDEIEIRSLKVFKALCISFYCVWLGLISNDSQVEAYENFRLEDIKIYRIFD